MTYPEADRVEYLEGNSKRPQRKKFQQIKARFPLLRPKLHLPYGALQALATPL